MLPVVPAMRASKVLWAALQKTRGEAEQPVKNVVWAELLVAKCREPMISKMSFIFCSLYFEFAFELVKKWFNSGHSLDCVSYL